MIFFQGNAFQNVCEMGTILSQPKYVKSSASCRYMATQIWINTDSCNGLLSDGTKPLSEPILSNHRKSLSAIQPREISQEILNTSTIDMSLKVTNLR